MILADPRDRPLPMMPAGRVPAPVVGLTGAAAKAALKAKAGAEVTFGRVERRSGRRRGAGGAGAVAAAAPAPFSSRGPPSTARRSRTCSPRAPRSRRQGIVAGTAVAAAPHGRARRAAGAAAAGGDARPGSRRRSCPPATEEEGAAAVAGGPARPARADALAVTRSSACKLRARRLRARRPARGRHDDPARLPPRARARRRHRRRQADPDPARRRPRPAPRRVRLPPHQPGAQGPRARRVPLQGDRPRATSRAPRPSRRSPRFRVR